ncbi:hypothetical protein WISP_10665 [Willisornis vidua]|uniref:Uncharacterized protein n=1 Tax=Willisornis vidua TaxID=1566151 RepID=A0ABQ9DX50_9PASS|nr:hypothetical protein WISP_10665 [Willisornis vidua]
MDADEFCMDLSSFKKYVLLKIDLFYDSKKRNRDWYFRCPADSSELAYDPPAVMNADTLSYCQKEAWCKLAFYLLSFFYYLYWNYWNQLANSFSLIKLASDVDSAVMTEVFSELSNGDSQLGTYPVGQIEQKCPVGPIFSLDLESKTSAFKTGIKLCVSPCNIQSVEQTAL